MGTSLRLTSLVLTAVIFGLKPTDVRSLDADPIDQLSFWHPADQVPCLMYSFTSSDGCQCDTLFDLSLIITDVTDP